MKLFLCTFLYVGVLSTCEALMCWECNNVWSDLECLEKGRLRKCNPNENSCQTEIRRGGWGFAVMITKHCKQALACQNNHIQNPREAWYNMQCNLRSPSGVCRCCCSTDECNRFGLQCWEDEIVKCPLLPPIQKGSMVCSKDNEVGSACKFTCDPGYVLVGSQETLCATTQKWDNPVPICKPVTCLPVLQSPFGGNVDCTNENVLGSICTFSCDSEFILKGAKSLQCDHNSENEAIWSDVPATCEGAIVADVSVECFEEIQTPVNGDVECSDGKKVGSRCEFTCYLGFALIGDQIATCVNDEESAIWQNLPPKCKEIACPSVPTNPINGQVFCTNGNKFGSKCDFTCDEGFALNGFSSTVCSEEYGRSDVVGIWSNPVPFCGEAYCLPEQTNPVNGKVFCSNGNKIGSTCDFTCEVGFVLNGFSSTLCYQPGNSDIIGVWTNPQPFCEELKCSSPPDAPDHGERTCSDDNRLGSECSFECDDLYKVVGHRTSTCMLSDENKAVWSRPSPVCELIVCKSQSVFRHGKSDCTNGSFPGSTCTFQCTSNEYHMHPPTFEKNTCQLDSYWDVSTPCCAINCPPNAVMDFIIVLDSSSSVGISNWKKVKKFIRHFLQEFTVSPKTSHFGIFRYNEFVDTKTQILLKDFPDNKEELLEAFDRIHYDGSGTHTGNAIKHVNKVMLASTNGNRRGARDIVLIITDGRSQDNATSEAITLRERGALVYVIPVAPPRGSLDMKEIRDIAGSEKNIIKEAVEKGFEALTKDFSSRVAATICGDPCDNFLVFQND